MAMKTTASDLRERPRACKPGAAPATLASTLASTLATTLTATLMLAACGSDPEPDPPAPPVASDTVPASATVDSRSYTNFVGSLTASESAVPLRLDGVTPPTSETEVPLPLGA